MDTALHLFRDTERITASALGEPSVTLLRNDDAFCLLLAQGAEQDSYSGRLKLEGVSHLHVFGMAWSYTDFDSVTLLREDGVWLAKDEATVRYFRNPSLQPYRVVFVAPDDFARLRYCRAEGLAFPVFEFAQRAFGRLPGFACRPRVLESPDDYATTGAAVPQSKYVFRG